MSPYSTHTHTVSCCCCVFCLYCTLIEAQKDAVLVHLLFCCGQKEQKERRCNACAHECMWYVFFFSGQSDGLFTHNLVNMWIQRVLYTFLFLLPRMPVPNTHKIVNGNKLVMCACVCLCLLKAWYSSRNYIHHVLELHLVRRFIQRRHFDRKNERV